MIILLDRVTVCRRAIGLYRFRASLPRSGSSHPQRMGSTGSCRSAPVRSRTCSEGQSRPVETPDCPSGGSRILIWCKKGVFMYKCFFSGHFPLDLIESGVFTCRCKNLNRTHLTADLRKDRPMGGSNEKNPCFGCSFSQGCSGPGREDASLPTR